jgi:hypothetical protein
MIRKFSFLHHFKWFQPSKMVLLYITSWKFWMCVLIVLILMTYLIWGGNRSYEVVGLKPLQEALGDGFGTLYSSHDTPMEFDYQKVEPSSVEPSSVEPSSVEPSSVEPSSVEPSSVEPSSVEPSSVEPSSVQHFLSQGDIQYSFRSVGEELCYIALKNLIGETTYRIGYRDSSLANPETRQPLEIDIYCPEYKIGIEYNGKQHYEFVKQYHSGYDKYEAQIRRDHYKNILCKQNGIHLITVPYTIDTLEFLPNGKTKTVKSLSVRYKNILYFIQAALECYKKNIEFDINNIQGCFS